MSFLYLGHNVFFGEVFKLCSTPEKEKGVLLTYSVSTLSPEHMNPEFMSVFVDFTGVCTFLQATLLRFQGKGRSSEDRMQRLLEG